MATATYGKRDIRSQRRNGTIYFVAVFVVALIAIMIIMSRDNSSSSLIAPDGPASRSTDTLNPADSTVPRVPESPNTGSGDNRQ